MRQEQSSQTIVSVNPFRCRMWALHDRLEDQITEESCRGEIESIMRHGQLVPVLGRRLQGAPMHEIERRMLFKTLAFYDNNKVKAAQALGVTTKTIYTRLTAYQSAGKENIHAGGSGEEA